MMQRIDLYQRRGNHKIHTLECQGDVTGKINSFVVKEDRSLSGIRLIYKTYTPGSSSNSIDVTYNSLTKISTIQIQIYRADTYSLTGSEYVYDYNLINPNDSEDVTSIFDGKFNLDIGVQSPFDGITVPGIEYVNQGADKLLYFKILSDGTGTEEVDIGFDTSLIITRNGLGVYKVVSAEAIWDEKTFLTFCPVNKMNFDKFLIFDYYMQSTTVLFIKVNDFYRGLTDADFRIRAERVRL